jgi:ABC-type multidrug transport system permease subunit
MRRKKLLKRLVATPMSRPQFLASFLLSRLVLLVLEVAALVGFGVLVFQVPLRGPLWVLGVVSVLGSLAFSGLGLLISSRAQTMEGASGLMNAAMLPMWILSGVFFSSSHFPAVMQPLVKALPLTAVNDALRANMLEGASIAAVWPQLAVVLAWAVICFTLALRLFRWR